MIEGLYIHIPFCNIKCPYCDFTSITLESRDIFKLYIQTLKKELLLYKDYNINLKTIYLGGGTPSILETSLIRELISFIKENFKVKKNPEITIEVNPKTYRYTEFLYLKDIGINRVSIGVQSFLDKNLHILGRNHSAEDSLETIEDCLKAGLKNINLDLIYGIEGQTLEDLKKDLEIYTSLDITHISAYMLTAYNETPLGKLVKDGKFKLPTDEELEEMYIFIVKYLKEKGFYQYEISNWAKDGYKSKHNLLYWKVKEFLGIGVSAWSFVDNVRFGNTKNLYEYMEKVNKGEKPILFKELIERDELKNEKIMLGLRLTEGIDKSLIEGKEEILESLKYENLLSEDNGKIKLTPKGFLLSNYIISKLLD